MKMTETVDGVEVPAGPAAKSGSTGTGLRARGARAALQSVGIGLFFVVVCLYFSSRSDTFLTVSNIAGIAAIAAPLGIVAIGQTIAIVSGGFDLSVGGALPLGAVTFGIAADSMSFVPATLVAAAVGGGVGLLNGVIVEKLRINPFICTLATLSVTGGAAFVLTNGQTKELPTDAGFWGDRIVGDLQYCVIAFAVVALAVLVLLRYSRLGRAIYAIGGNREAAELAGIRCSAIVQGVYVSSGVFAGFAGAVTASQLLAAAPSVGSNAALGSISAVIVGGAALTGGSGGVVGTVLGILLLGSISNGLTILQVNSYYQTIWTGIILLVAVAFGRVREVLLRKIL
ncbi:ABC transporter permease [Amycolatopsis pigmentata]|uniref:ABC transporter permease n=1 Tax=Amycolatopsis pigmentata TaxID=450801 RepID=A0ABW5G013_9PSEU